MRASAIVLYRQIGSDAKGLARLSELNAVEQLAKFVAENVKKSEMVINVYDAFLEFVKNLDVLREKEICEMVDSAMLGLKSDPDDVPLCRKALELLLALAEKSQFVRDMLSFFILFLFFGVLGDFWLCFYFCLNFSTFKYIWRLIFNFCLNTTKNPKFSNVIIF